MLEISCCPSAKDICLFGCYRLHAYSITPLLPMAFENIVAGKLSNFLEGNSLLPPSQFSFRRKLRTWDALLTLSHSLQFALDRGLFNLTS